MKGVKFLGRFLMNIIIVNIFRQKLNQDVVRLVLPFRGILSRFYPHKWPHLFNYWANKNNQYKRCIWVKSSVYFLVITPGIVYLWSHESNMYSFRLHLSKGYLSIIAYVCTKSLKLEKNTTKKCMVLIL